MIRIDSDRLGLSTAWNRSRHATLRGAVAELAELGPSRVVIEDVNRSAAVSEAAKFLAGTGLRCAAVSVALDEATSLSTETSAARGLAEVAKACKRAARLRAGVVIVDGGRLAGDDVAPGTPGRRAEPAVETLCRSLHAVFRAHPGLTVALRTPEGPGGLPSAAELEWIAESLPRERLALWHDAGLAAVREAAGWGSAAEWTDRWGSLVCGAYLSDVSGLECGLPPGSGCLDWGQISLELSGSFPMILRLSAGCGRFAIEEALRFVGLTQE